MMSAGELAFGKLGYLKYENRNMIVYYKMNDSKDELQSLDRQDVTFLKRTQKIIFYHGSNFGPDAFTTTHDLLKAVHLVCRELGWLDVNVE